MAKYIQFAVTDIDPVIINTETVVTVLRTASTTTKLYIAGGTGTVAAGATMTLTHAADTVGSSVQKAITDAILSMNLPGSNPVSPVTVTLPKAVSTVTIVA
jgi:hypothetical protein